MTFLLHYFLLKHLYRRVNKLRLGMYKISEKQQKSIPDTTKPEKCSSSGGRVHWEVQPGRSLPRPVPPSPGTGTCTRHSLCATTSVPLCRPAQHSATRHRRRRRPTIPAVSSLDRVLAGGQLSAESKFQLRCNFNFGNFLQKRPTWITFKTKGRIL